MAWLLIIIALCVVIPALVSFSILRLPRLGVVAVRPSALTTKPGYAPLEIAASDGVVLKGYVVEAPHPKGTVVLVHGWGTNIADLDGDAEFFLSQGFTVAGCDLRGHGASGGHHSQLGFAEVDDLRRLLSHLRDQRRLPRPVVLAGVSLGATVAFLAAAEEPDVAGVIADSPFNRLEDAVDHYAACSVPFLIKYPLRWLTLRMVELQVGHRLSTLSVESVLPRLAPRPILLVHCEGDGLVLCENSDQIAAAYPDHTTYWRVPGGNHLQSRWLDPEQWERRMREFLRQVASDPQP